MASHWSFFDGSATKSSTERIKRSTLIDRNRGLLWSIRSFSSQIELAFARRHLGG